MPFLCFFHCGRSEVRGDRRIESIKIYRLLIDRFYFEKEGQTVVVNQFNDSIPGTLEPIFHSPKIDRDTLDDFEFQNQQSDRITDYFPLHSNVVFMAMNARERKEYPGNIETHYFVMKRLNRLFPDSGGIITFSKIGFNEQMSQGLLRFHIGKWPSRHRDYVVLMKKDKSFSPSVWKIEESSFREYFD